VDDITQIHICNQTWFGASIKTIEAGPAEPAQFHHASNRQSTVHLAKFTIPQNQSHTIRSQNWTLTALMQNRPHVNDRL
jgi:hypothetical protein